MSTPMLTALVKSMRHEADGVVSLELRPTQAGASFPAFTAGAHIDVQLPNALVRSYSLLNPETERGRYVIGVLLDRNTRGGSRCVHEQLRVGMTVPVSAPRNNFPLDLSAPCSVLVAGGIGITPLMSMHAALASRGMPVEFIYCARSRREAAFLDELAAMAQAAGSQLTLHFDDERGAPPDMASLLKGHAADTHLYCCGPGPMLDAFDRACASLGYVHVHTERFAANPSSLAPPSAADAGSGYQVELRRSGMTLDVPSGKPLLDVLLDAGVAQDYSCREGICGACETRVLSGEVEHHDSILTRAERESNKTMMVCVSRCRQGTLVLDI
jgi:ferredoxin-NADP reductase